MCSPHKGFYRQRLFADLMEVLIWETQIPVVIYICSLFSYLFVHIYSLRHRKCGVQGFIHELFVSKTRTSEERASEGF